MNTWKNNSEARESWDDVVESYDVLSSEGEDATIDTPAVGRLESGEWLYTDNSDGVSSLKMYGSLEDVARHLRSLSDGPVVLSRRQHA